MMGGISRSLLGGGLLIPLVMLYGCLQTGEMDTIGVVVTLAPQREMIQAIGGDRVRVTVMVPIGESPHTYAPIPSQLMEVAKARIYFKMGSGVEFELKHLDEIASQNKDMKIVDCSSGVTLLESRTYKQEEGEDVGKDPHIWLSPENAKRIVENMCEGLVTMDPANRKYYEDNRDSYLTKLSELDAEIRDRLKGKEGSAFLVFHPAWAYFADAYNLTQLAIEEEGKEPGPAAVAKIIEQAKENGIKIVFVSPEFDKSSAETIAEEIGGRVVTVDPLAEDYIENLRTVSARIAEGLAK